jgi:hypothetical protein
MNMQSISSFLRKRVLAAAALCAAVLVSERAFAFDTTTVFPTDQTITLRAKTWVSLQNSAGPEDDDDIHDVSVVRSAIVSGMCTLTATVTSNRPDLLNIRLLMANDGNSNGTIDANEWAVVAVANAVPQGTGRIAQTAGTNVPAGQHAYRIEHNWTWGQSTDDIKDRLLQ